MWKKIEKFRPKYADLPTMVSNVNVLLRVLTLNVDSRVKNPISIASYLVTGSCTVCYYYAYHFSLLWFLTWKTHYPEDLAAMIVFGSLSVSSNIATIKLWYMLACRSNLQYLVDQCLESDALTEPYTRFASNLTSLLRIVKKRAISVWLCVNIISVLYVSIPAFMTGRHLPEDLIVFYGLEPPFETPYFQISYCIMISCVLFICYIVATITAFVVIIFGYTEVQMISLSKEINCIWDDSVQDFRINHIFAFPKNGLMFDDYTMNKINSGVRKRLIKIMQRHSKIIIFLKNMNEFFNVPNAIAFGCLGISLIAELLGGLENTYLQVPFTFVQVAMDCYMGQKIMDASVAFEKSVYACKWEKFDNENMKIVLLMLQNSQKTLTVTAGSMAVMNFSYLMTIVRSVYSAYTALRSTV